MKKNLLVVMLSAFIMCATMPAVLASDTINDADTPKETVVIEEKAEEEQTVIEETVAEGNSNIKEEKNAAKEERLNSKDEKIENAAQKRDSKIDAKRNRIEAKEDKIGAFTYLKEMRNTVKNMKIENRKSVLESFADFTQELKDSSGKITVDYLKAFFETII